MKAMVGEMTTYENYAAIVSWGWSASDTMVANQRLLQEEESSATYRAYMRASTSHSAETSTEKTWRGTSQARDAWASWDEPEVQKLAAYLPHRPCRQRGCLKIASMDELCELDVERQ